MNIEEKMTETTVVDNIVIGLPIEIQAKLDREKLTSTVKLQEELAKIPTPVHRASGLLEANKIHGINMPQFNKIDKKPCGYCDSKGFPNRSHSVDQCRLKLEDSAKAQVKSSARSGGGQNLFARTPKSESNHLHTEEYVEGSEMSAAESGPEHESSGNLSTRRSLSFH